jgi:hypothetical protein
VRRGGRHLVPLVRDFVRAARGCGSVSAALPRRAVPVWHRDGQNVIRAGVQANPWGLADRGLAPYVAAYPGSSLAAMAAFWADRSEALLRFEEAHPGNCHRVRHEDLARHPGSVADEISAFVGADAALPTAMATPAELSRGGLPGVTDGEAGTGRDGNGKDGGPGGLGLPAGLMPRGLADRVNDLQARLGYAPLQLVWRRQGTAPRYGIRRLAVI